MENFYRDPGATASPNSNTILIVEDNPWIRESLKDALEFHGYTVKTANNGKEALEAIQVPSQHPKVIFLDLMMPVMDGYSFIKEVENDPVLSKVPIVVLSAVGDQKNVSPIVKKVLTKPVWVDNLLDTARTFCEASSNSATA